MPSNRWTSLTVALLVLTVGRDIFAASAPRYTVKRWELDEQTPGNHLPQSSVFSIIQTHDGYLWLGTGRGLTRFDGVHFKTFDGSNTPGLEEEAKVVKLFEDSRRNLWIGTDTGTVLLVGPEGKIEKVDVGKSGQDGPLVNICEDTHGTVWLRMSNGFLYGYRDGQPHLIADGRFGSVAADKSGIVWAGGRDGYLLGYVFASSGYARKYRIPIGAVDFLLASVDGGYWCLANKRILKFQGDRKVRDFAPFPWNEGTPILAACEDRSGNLIVGTHGGGVYWLDADGRFPYLEGLSQNYILALAMDREGNLWVGMNGGGVNRVEQQTFHALEGSTVLTVQTVAADAQGGLWFGVIDGTVRYWQNGKIKVHDLGKSSVRAVLVDRRGRVWAGTAGDGLFELQDGTFLPVAGTNFLDREISAMFQDRNGMLWVGTEKGLGRWDEKEWKIFTTGDGLSSDAVRAITDDSQGNLWIGTVEGGVNRLREGKFECFTRSNGLPSNHIFSLCEDDQSVLWAGTAGGLGRFESGKWTSFTKSEGLPNTSLSYLLDDGAGSLWIGSTAGLIRARKKDLAGDSRSILFRSYGQADGLPASECTSGCQPGACREPDGTLWFSTTRGLASVNPTQLRPNTNAPPVLIESVRIDEQLETSDKLRAPAPDTITVPAGAESLEIGFTSLNLAAPYSGRFKYRLDPLESAWIEKPGDVRFVRYTKIPHGDYRFQVTACNEDFVWNDHGATLAVKVLPPFWRTWWFLSLVSVCLLGAIVGSVHYVSTQKLHRQLEHHRQQEALERERARIARDLHDQLGANLTQVSLLGEMAESDKDDPAEVEAHARQISQTAVETTRALDEIVWTVNPSNDTLDGLINYVCKYAQEYVALAGLRYRLEVPPQLPNTPISPELRHNVFLAAKECINNVVKHAHATSAWLRLRLEPERFTLEIEDNGRGLPADAENKGRNGLRNMRKRLEDIGGTFEVGAGSEGGTKVKLTAPLQKPAAASR